MAGYHDSLNTRVEGEQGEGCFEVLDHKVCEGIMFSGAVESDKDNGSRNGRAGWDVRGADMMEGKGCVRRRGGRHVESDDLSFLRGKGKREASA